jgi:hypothetical protein
LLLVVILFVIPQGTASALSFAFLLLSSHPGFRHGTTKNKVEIRGMFFSTQKHAVTAPRLPRIPPQLHHKNTTPKTPISPKHPSKTPIKPQSSPRHHIQNFF